MPVPGPLAWRDDVLLAVSGVIGFPELTPEEKVEAEREAEIFAALARKKPGRRPGRLLTRASDPQIANYCLTKARGNMKAAKRDFIASVKKGMSKKALEKGSADTTALRRWYQATKADGGSRRARQK
jgi:hypothetical protein